MCGWLLSGHGSSLPKVGDPNTTAMPRRAASRATSIAAIAIVDYAGDRAIGESAMECSICGRRLEQPDDPLSADCGGDCRGCIGWIEADMGHSDSQANVREEVARGLRPGRIDYAGPPTANAAAKASPGRAA